MQIGVEGLRQTVSVGCLAEHREVADGIRLVREGGPRDDPRCIVDGAHECQPGTALRKPVLPAAIGLHEHPGPRHPVAPAAVAWWSPGADRRKPGLAKETADGPGRDAQVGLLLFLQPLRQVDRVEALVGRPGELQQPASTTIVESVARTPTPVAVDQRSGPARPVSVDQPTDLPDRQTQDPCRLIERQLASEHMVEDI